MDSWRFRKKQGACTGCERTFDDGERHTSLLAVEEETLGRSDLCAPCWEARPASDDDLFWWCSRYESGRKRTLALDLASLERLFVELEGRDGERLVELRYLVCLLLMRKRKLKLLRVRRAREGEYLLVRRPRRKEELEVPVRDFRPEQLEELTVRLRAVLDGAEGGEGAGGSAGEHEETGGEAADPAAAREKDA
ncbi:MAG: hypothetical protein QF903_08245 [Planctomycetota bacterium]|jgi:hypothetical protein|nr:hypothetical protein [Planctomycetota bacterium]MDP6763325.1 hypothetical protein [Planctomycetota bacterium]MDP6989455.1 hypothetical protein [Planctomycetota bacterium]